MKRSLPRIISHPFSVRRPGGLALAVATAAALGSVVYFVRAQSSDSPLSDQSVSAEAALYTITHPEEAAALADAQLTPEEKAKKVFALWAIQNPGEYYKQFVKNDPARLVPKEAQEAMLNPVEACARALANRTPEQKAEDERISYGIEHPAPAADVAR